MRIKKDGDKYLVSSDNFKNLQESNDYFFISEDEYNKFIGCMMFIYDESIDVLSEHGKTNARNHFEEWIHVKYGEDKYDIDELTYKP